MAPQPNGYRHRALAILTLLMSLATTDAASAGIEVLVSAGDASPDGNGLFTALIFEPSLNDSGQYGFAAVLNGTAGPPADTAGFFRGGVGGLTTVARTTQPFAGTTITDIAASSAYMDNSGNITGLVSLPDGGFQTFTGNGGALTPLALPNSPSPSGNDSLRAVTNLVVNDSGTTIYRAIYDRTNGGSETGVYKRAVDGTKTTLFRTGDVAPGGGVFDFFGSTPVLNESDQMAFAWDIDDNGESYDSLIRRDGSTMTEVARQGDTIDDGITEIVSFGGPEINDSGDIGFWARYSQPGLERPGMFLTKNGVTTLTTPATLPGATSAMEFPFTIGLSADGTVGFHTSFVSSFDSDGIYKSGLNGPSLVAMEDSATPDSSQFFQRFYRNLIAMNEDGDLAFVADLSDAPSGVKSGRGIYLHDSTNGLQELIRSGDTLAGNTIDEVYFMGSNPSFGLLGSDNSFSGLNEAGQVAFAYSLTNGGGGIALWTPETTTLACDFDGDGNCDQDDIDALYATGDKQLTEILDWLSAASSSDNLTNPNGETLQMGDLDFDGHVDSIDLGNLLNNFDSTASLPWRFGNINDDALVDSLDLGLLLNNFDSNAASANAVPEPRGFYLLLVVFTATTVRSLFDARRRTTA